MHPAVLVIGASLLGIGTVRAVKKLTAKKKPSRKQGSPKGVPPVNTPALPSAPAPRNTGGHAWALGEIPKRGGLQRDAAIMAAFDAGVWLWPGTTQEGWVGGPWIPVTYQKDGHTVTIYTWPDCLAIGTENPVRINCGHATAQRIADKLDAMLPTSRMADMAYVAATKIGNIILGASNEMDTSEKMVEHSDKVGAARDRSGASFVRDVGKDWVNTERLLGGTVLQAPTPQIAMPSHSSIGGGGGSIPAGANYGWHGGPSPNLAGMGVWQNIGLAHDMNYSDYSQVCTLYRRDCEIDGWGKSIEEALRDPDTAYLLSDEVKRGTPCRVWRHPAVPEGG